MDAISSSSTAPDDIAIEIVSPPSRTDALIDAWFVETFHNIGLDAPLFNRFRSAADGLKARLARKE